MHVDEDWKQAVAEDKARAREHEQKPPGETPKTSETAGKRGPLPEPSIQLFMAGLYAQTLMLLGEMENPATGEKTVDVQEAAYMVDTIALLRDKTKGNLTPEESAYVQNILTDLRMRYVSATGASRAADDEADERPT